LLAPDEKGDEDELPDQAGRENEDQRLRHRHVPGAAKPVGKRRRDDPGEDAHRQRSGRPHAKDLDD
jgi:hypothetical protein